MRGVGGDVRVVMARAYLVVGLVTACFALYAMLDPAPTYRQLLQLQQMIKDSDMPQLDQGLTDRLATAMQMRDDGVLVLLLATAQALLTMAAAAAESRVGTFLAMLLSVPLVWRLAAVFLALAG